LPINDRDAAWSGLELEPLRREVARGQRDFEGGSTLAVPVTVLLHERNIKQVPCSGLQREQRDHRLGSNTVSLDQDEIARV
jgi:hypothetical protein